MWVRAVFLRSYAGELPHGSSLVGQATRQAETLFQKLYFRSSSKLGA